MIVDEGYDYEVHEVETDDGYILRVHRLYSKNIGSADARPVVFLMHGLMGSASDYLVLGKNKALGFLLFDNGFDVYIGNNRGTEYSQKHKSLNRNSSGFWNFSFHEIGLYDLSAIIDYVLNITKKPSLFYVGHSQGTTDFLVLLSTKPKYNQKIKQAHLMAPVAFMDHPLALLKPIAGTFDVRFFKT